MSWFLTNLISAFLLPPLNLLVLGLIGLWLWHKRPFIARTLLTMSIALLWLFSTPFFAEMLMHSLEGAPFANNTSKPAAGAIVVLGGGTYFNAPEYGGDTVSEAALVRVRYAAKLHRETGLPILVTGGKPLGNSLSEAQQMKQVLEQEFHVPVKWTEDESSNTTENAQFTKQILQTEQLKRVYLVTHAWHMPRAVLAFHAAGMEVIPAPTAFATHHAIGFLDFLPSAYALRDSRVFLHEFIGLFWYQLKSGH